MLAPRRVRQTSIPLCLIFIIVFIIIITITIVIIIILIIINSNIIIMFIVTESSGIVIASTASVHRAGGRVCNHRL